MTILLPILLAAVFIPLGELLFRGATFLGSLLQWTFFLARSLRAPRALVQVWKFVLHLPWVLTVIVSGVPWRLAAVLIVGLVGLRLLLGGGPRRSVHWKRECGLELNSPLGRAFTESLRISRRDRRILSGVWSPWVAVALAMLLHRSSEALLWPVASHFSLWALASALVDLDHRARLWVRATAFVGSLLLGGLLLAVAPGNREAGLLAVLGAAGALVLRMWSDAREKGMPRPATARVFDPARISSGQFMQQMGFSGTDEARPWVRTLVRLRTLSLVLTSERTRLLVWRADLLAAIFVVFLRAV